MEPDAEIRGQEPILLERASRPASKLVPERPRRSDLLGRSLTWLCGGALAINLLFVVGILGLLAVHGLTYFWQSPLELFELSDGRRLLAEVWNREPIPVPAGQEEGSAGTRLRLKVANRDIDGVDFVWIDGPDVVKTSYPWTAILLERREWGNFHGFARELVGANGQTLATGEPETWKALQPLLARKAEQRDAVEDLEDQISDLNYDIEKQRLAARKVTLEDLPAAEAARRKASIAQSEAALHSRYDTLAAEVARRRRVLMAEQLVVQTADGTTKRVPVGDIVRAIRPNAIGLGGRLALYLSRAWEFVSADPRESNTEGGIFPAIFGTVMMVFLMSFAVAPLGVLAALYLREYAKQGVMVQIVRIAVNNLAGVPSIVFGVFGLGFFVYLVGGTIDRLFFPEALPTPTYGTGGILWGALTLALLTVPVVIVAAEEGLAAVPRVVREGSLALGATKFETLWRVVVPAAAPGILTGMILAMARAAGEVAPLMIVGMVKLAPSLPIDGHFPFLHPERKFMHLGFHIYDVGFQSPNVEATKPLVYATALLLIALVVLMNLLAIALRNHLRKKSAGSSV